MQQLNMDLRETLLVVGASACSFKLINKIVQVLPIPKSAQQKAWRWRNIITSLTHSSLTGVWAVLCFYEKPQMVKDLISSHSLFSYRLVAVSTGYFIYDISDAAMNQPLHQSWEILLHHSVVISCFSLAVTSRLYLGFAVVSLLVEINSIFLHIRQLLLLSGRKHKSAAGLEEDASRPSVMYRLNTWLNLGTFLVFRVCTLGWMSRWLAGHRDCLPRGILMMGAAGLSVISTVNIVLFYRLLRADVLNTKRSH